MHNVKICSNNVLRPFVCVYVFLARIFFFLLLFSDIFTWFISHTLLFFLFFWSAGLSVFECNSKCSSCKWKKTKNGGNRLYCISYNLRNRIQSINITLLFIGFRHPHDVWLKEWPRKSWKSLPPLDQCIVAFTCYENVCEDPTHVWVWATPFGPSKLVQYCIHTHNNTIYIQYTPTNTAFLRLLRSAWTYQQNGSTISSASLQHQLLDFMNIIAAEFPFGSIHIRSFTLLFFIFKYDSM